MTKAEEGPISHCVLNKGKARRQDAALPIPRPLHRRPLVPRGDGQPAGAAGQAGRVGAGPRAVGGIRLLLARNLTAPDWVRERFAKSLLPSLLLPIQVLVNI